MKNYFQFFEYNKIIQNFDLFVINNPKFLLLQKGRKYHPIYYPFKGFYYFINYLMQLLRML